MSYQLTCIDATLAGDGCEQFVVALGVSRLSPSTFAGPDEAYSTEYGEYG